MPGVPSTVLALLAVVGFLLPSVPYVHAHEGGHEPHDHGGAHRFHVALHTHPAHAATHVHPHVTDVDEGDENSLPDEEGSPEPHAHGGDALGALARPRTRDCVALAPGGPVHALVCGALDLGATMGLARPAGAVWLDGKDPGRAPARVIDFLVATGRLRI